MEALNVIFDIENEGPNEPASGLQWKYLSYEQRKYYQKKQSCFIRKPESELPKYWHPDHYRLIHVCCIGYRVIKVYIPKYKDLNGITILHFYRNLLPLLKEDGIPSVDYKVISQLGGRQRKVNDRGITSRIIERIDEFRCHLLTIEQFCNIDFVAYFKAFESAEFKDQIFQHYIRNVGYLAHLKNSTHSYRFHDRLRYQLETNPLEFAIEHLDKMSCMSPKHQNRSMYLTNKTK